MPDETQGNDKKTQPATAKDAAGNLVYPNEVYKSKKGVLSSAKEEAIRKIFRDHLGNDVRSLNMPKVFEEMRKAVQDVSEEYIELKIWNSLFHKHGRREEFSVELVRIVPNLAGAEVDISQVVQRLQQDNYARFRSAVIAIKGKGAQEPSRILLEFFIVIAFLSQQKSKHMYRLRGESRNRRSDPYFVSAEYLQGVLKLFTPAELMSLRSPVSSRGSSRQSSRRSSISSLVDEGEAPSSYTSLMRRLPSEELIQIGSRRGEEDEPEMPYVDTVLDAETEEEDVGATSERALAASLVSPSMVSLFHSALILNDWDIEKVREELLRKLM